MDLPIVFTLGFKDWHLDHLVRCLGSIRRHTNATIVLADLGSRHFKAVRSIGEDFKTRVVSAPREVWSRGVALNVAAKALSRVEETRTTTLVFTDADMLFTKSWFSTVRRLLGSEESWDPDRCTFYLTPSRDLSPAATADLGPWWMPRPSDEALFGLSDPHPLVGQGAAMIVPYPWFVKVGGFDETYDTWGCLSAEARVILANGRRVKISKIVNKRLPALVKSLNLRTNTIEAKPVVKWWRALGPEGQLWLKIILQGGGKSKQGRRGLVLTPDHRVLTKEGWRRADQLAPGMLVALDDPLLTPRQREMILGSTLGDGSITSRNKTARASFSVSHVRDQWPYLDLKARLLGDLLGATTLGLQRGNRQAGKKIGTRHTRELGELRALCYPNGTKNVSWKWLRQVGPFGFAVYFLDDGFGGKRDTNICSKKLFGLEGAELIIKRLHELGCGGIVDQKKRGQFVIRMRVTESEAFTRLVGKYIPPAMRYKVPRVDAEPFEPSLWELENTPPRPTWVVIESVEVYRPRTGVTGRDRYCITVEGNGNFFTPSGLVKNCEDNDLVIRAGWDGLPVEWLPDERACVYHQYHSRTWPTPEQFERVRRNRTYLADRIREGGPIVRNQGEGGDG